MRQELFVGILTALLVVLLTPAAAFAQQTPPTFGLVASTPGASIGFMWQYSETLGVRPEFAWSRTSSSLSTSTGDTVNLSTGPAIAVLFYTRKWDAVRAYISPRYAYAHNHTTATSGTTVTSESTTNVHNLSGSLGAEYAAHRHFAAFGEVGLNYAHSHGENSFNTTVATSNSWGIRASVGAIFYF